MKKAYQSEGVYAAGTCPVGEPPARAQFNRGTGEKKVPLQWQLTQGKDKAQSASPEPPGFQQPIHTNVWHACQPSKEKERDR